MPHNALKDSGGYFHKELELIGQKMKTKQYYALLVNMDEIGD